MISLHASAVLLVRNSFSGQVIEGGSITCTLDGAPVRPVVKAGGYLVLVNLPAGPHQLQLRAPYFQGEQVDLVVKDGQTASLYPALRPAESCYFREPPTRLSLRWKGTGPLWLAAPGALTCKLAQPKAEAGAAEVRLFCKGGLGRLPIPGPFLVEDGKKSELAVLTSSQGESAYLAQPLTQEHGRGCCLLPVCPYSVQDGRISAIFPQPGTALAFAPGWEKAKPLELSQGENTLSL